MVQVALVAVLIGVMLILLGGGGAMPRPQTVRTYRPATEQEERQREADQLAELLKHIQEERQREQAPR